MEESVIILVDNYAEILTHIKRVCNGDAHAAIAILQEVGKDMRTARINDGAGPKRALGDEEPATQRQLDYMAKLGIESQGPLTRKRASALIDEALGKSKPAVEKVRQRIP